MKSDVIHVTNDGTGIKEAHAQAEKVASFLSLDKKSSLHLVLFTEEMMSMMQTIAGDVNGTFHIEKEGPRFDLNLTVKTVLDRKQRDLLIASTSSRKNDITKSFLGRLRDAFEQAMASDKEKVFLDLSQDSKDTSLKDWDRYEQSVLLRLADSVRIAIRGGLVSMTVTKVFSE